MRKYTPLVRQILRRIDNILLNWLITQYFGTEIRINMFYHQKKYHLIIVYSLRYHIIARKRRRSQALEMCVLSDDLSTIGAGMGGVVETWNAEGDEAASQPCDAHCKQSAKG